MPKGTACRIGLRQRFHPNDESISSLASAALSSTARFRRRQRRKEPSENPRIPTTPRQARKPLAGKQVSSNGRGNGDHNEVGPSLRSTAALRRHPRFSARFLHPTAPVMPRPASLNLRIAGISRMAENPKLQDVLSVAIASRTINCTEERFPYPEWFGKVAQNLDVSGVPSLTLLRGRGNFA